LMTVTIRLVTWALDSLTVPGGIMGRPEDT
jgi:hypothetical protein